MYIRQITTLLSKTLRYSTWMCQNVMRKALVSITKWNAVITYPEFQSNRRFCSTNKDNGSETVNADSVGDSDKYDSKKDPFFTQDVAYGAQENKGKGDPQRPYFDPSANDGIIEDEEPPTNCCRSGCPNCVWIEYVEKLSLKYTNPDLSRERILKDLESMEDESIKAFIKLELKSRGLL